MWCCIFQRPQCCSIYDSQDNILPLYRALRVCILPIGNFVLWICIVSLITALFCTTMQFMLWGICVQWHTHHFDINIMFRWKAKDHVDSSSLSSLSKFKHFVFVRNTLWLYWRCTSRLCVLGQLCNWRANRCALQDSRCSCVDMSVSSWCQNPCLISTALIIRHWSECMYSRSYNCWLCAGSLTDKHAGHVASTRFCSFSRLVATWVILHHGLNNTWVALQLATLVFF